MTQRKKKILFLNELQKSLKKYKYPAKKEEDITLLALTADYQFLIKKVKKLHEVGIITDLEASESLEGLKNAFRKSVGL